MKKSTNILLFLSIVFLFCCQSYQKKENATSADDFIFEEHIKGTEITLSITGYKGNSKNVIVPEKINGSIVTSISFHRFFEDNSNISDIISIRLPTTIKTIGWRAFESCINLKEINIPEGVIEIESGAFYRCENLESILLPSTLISLSDNVFEYCTGLKTISVDRNNLNYNAINGVLFDKTGKTIIKYPAGRGGKYQIPHGIKTIGVGAFSDCKDLEDIYLSNTTEYISEDAFTRCTRLTSINIPMSVTSISEFAFNECNNLEYIDVSFSNRYYKSINGVLYDYSVKILIKAPALSIRGEYSMPNSVEIIAAKAFSECILLETLILSENLIRFCYSITYNDGYAYSAVFKGCNNLNNFIISDKNNNFETENGVLFGKYQYTLIAYPIGRKGGYIIPDHVAFLRWWSFADCLGLTEITISENINRIDNTTFEGCENIKYIYILNPDIDIQYATFRDCINIDESNKNDLINMFGETIFTY